MKRSIGIIAATIALSSFSIFANAQFSISVGIHINTAPPPIPVYTQPECPVDGYMWCPGYWAWDEVDGYYWVPGVWVMPPQPGYLWTPGYWGYDNGLYGWHDGYWDTQVGFYGGINYGYGYSGTGFYGGRWQAGRFQYNTAIVRVNRTVVRNVYIDRRVIINNNNRVAYNGGGGTRVRPTARQEQVMRNNHIRPTADQTRHNQSAERDRGQFAKVNKGRPQNTAIDRPEGRYNNPAQPNNNPARPNNNPVRPNNDPGRHNNSPRPNNNPVPPNNNNTTRPTPATPNRRPDNRFDNRRPATNPQQNTSPIPRDQTAAPRPHNRPQRQLPEQQNRPQRQMPAPENRPQRPPQQQQPNPARNNPPQNEHGPQGGGGRHH